MQNDNGHNKQNFSRQKAQNFPRENTQENQNTRNSGRREEIYEINAFSDTESDISQEMNSLHLQQDKKEKKVEKSKKGKSTKPKN